MKIFGLAMAAVLGTACLWGCGVREETSKPMPTMSVATYNLDHFSTETILAEGGRKTTSPGATRAAAIHQINADILILQEVKRGPLLSEFNRTQLADMGYKYMAVDAAADTEGLTLAVLSRFPIVNKMSHKEVPLDPALKGAEAGGPSNHFARDLYRVDVDTPMGRFAIYNVHLKSTSDFKDDPQSGKWRMREAEAVARIVKEETGREHLRNVLVAGDFNEPPTSAVVRTIEHAIDPPLQDGLAHRMLAHSAWSPAMQAEWDHRYTYYYKDVKSAVDMILVSPNIQNWDANIDWLDEAAGAGSHRAVWVEFLYVETGHP